jgi:hypothetical protein
MCYKDSAVAAVPLQISHTHHTNSWKMYCDLERSRSQSTIGRKWVASVAICAWHNREKQYVRTAALWLQARGRFLSDEQLSRPKEL